MKRRSVVRPALLAAGLALFAPPATAGPALLFSRDSGGGELLVRVDAEEAPVRCVYEGDDEGWPLALSCFQPDATEPFQRFDLTELETPYDGAELVAAVDMDRDGGDDLRMLASWGVTGNAFFVHYLWEPGVARFVRDPQYDVCRRPTDEKGCCTSRSGGGMAGNVYRQSLHCPIEGHLVEVERERQEWDEDDRCFHWRAERLIDGEWRQMGSEVRCDSDG